MLSFVMWSASASIQTNKGFLTHLKHLASSHISSKEWSPKLDDIDEERASSRSTTVSLSPPGNKRVSPLPPNNNPFRKQRAADDSLTFVSKRHIVSRDDEGEAEERVIRLQFNSDAFKKVEMSSLGAPLASSHSGSKRLFGRKEEVLPCGMKMLSHGCFVSEIGGDQVSIPPQDSYDMEVVQNGSMEEELELMCSSSSLNECVEELNPSCSSLSLNQKKQKQSNHESSCAVRYPKKFLESKKMKSNGKQGRQQTKKSSSMPTGIILTYFQRSNRTNLTNPIWWSHQYIYICRERDTHNIHIYVCRHLFSWQRKTSKTHSWKLLDTDNIILSALFFIYFFFFFSVSVDWLF